MKMDEQWPRSYLETFQPFLADSRSSKYMCALLDYHLNQPPLINSELSVLDICCGTGVAGRMVTDHLKNHGKKIDVTFLDKSEIILCNLMYGSEKTICADIALMPQVSSENYEVVVCRYGFNNLSQEAWLKSLNEVLRVMKPGGVFLLQDHFVPGSIFSALVNQAEQFLAKLEGKQEVPFIFSTEDFNKILDEHPLVASRVKAGYSLTINIWDRLRAKKEIIKDFEAAQQKILNFYKKICLEKFKVLIVEPEEYIPVYNVTYAIVKKILELDQNGRSPRG